MSMTGHCLCGAVKLCIDHLPQKVMHCHCTMCRRHSGAAFMTYAMFAAGDVHFTGQQPTYYQSSPEAQRGHCSTCGSPVSFIYSTDPDHIYIAAGVLDDAACLAPSEHWYAASMLPWLLLNDGLPRCNALPEA